MFAPVQQVKRRRSPSPNPFDSPDLALPSPLDVLAKRRRKVPGDESGNSHFNLHTDDYFSHGNGLPHEHHGHINGESSSALYAERRRTKQWERANAPRPSLPYTGTGQSQPLIDYTPPNPNLLARSYSQSEEYLPPATNHQYSHSQPLPQHHMSSSPIRHEPFGSSPFRPSSSVSLITPDSGFGSSSTRVGPEMMEEDDMDAEEMRRGWGEQYAQQNELLHSIHRQRRQAQQSFNSPMTPSIHTPQHYRTAQSSSSPFELHSSGRSRSWNGNGSGMMVEQDYVDGSHPPSDGPGMEMNSEDKMRYEEANRLLADLAMVRQNRWRN